MVLVTDPYPGSQRGATGKTTPSIVTVSNHHPNHNHLEGLPDDCHVIDGPGEYAISGTYVRGIMTPQASGQALENRNTAYFVEIEGLRVCHPGDLTSNLSGQHIDEVTPVDLLFVPAGGGCTLEASAIGDLIQTLNPRIVVPMHFKIAGSPEGLDDLGPFLREVGSKSPEPQNRLNITATSLPLETTVVVLTPVAN